MSDAPLLDLLDRLPTREVQANDTARGADEAPESIHLQACTMDELWLGDFELEDPRRVSLVDRIGQAFAMLVRTIALRCGFKRHSLLSFPGGRSPLPV